MKWYLALLSVLLVAVYAFAADNKIVPNNQGKAYLKDTGGNLWPASVVYTTDGNGNVVPVSSVIGNITIGTVNQGTNNAGGSQSWPVRDDNWQSVFNPWKVWADTALSTRASETTVGSLNSKINDGGGGSILVNGSTFTQPISASALPLPAGAATSANQTTANTSLSSIDTKTPALVGGRQPVDGSGVTQPISAASLPLPSGASTSALQTTGNTSLSSIDSKTATLVSGRTPVDPSGVTSPISAASLPLPTGAATSANQTTANTSLASIDGKLTSLGQKTSANSMPIVPASDYQFPITGITRLTEPSIGTDAAQAQVTIGPWGLQGTTAAPAMYSHWGKTFFAATAAVSNGNTTETPLFYFTNPNGSGKVVKFRRFVLGASTTASHQVIYNFYLNPTISANGTVVTPQGGRQTGQAVTAVSVFSAPTASSNGNLFFTRRIWSQSTDGFEDFNHELVLDPNNKLLITTTQSASAASGFVSAEWVEQ